MANMALFLLWRALDYRTAPPVHAFLGQLMGRRWQPPNTPFGGWLYAWTWL